MPYTLPQDSTLFLVLGEITPEIWMRKLDWIAEHGGMALVDVHPDYISFNGSPTDSNKLSSSVIPGIPHLRQNQVRRRVLACFTKGGRWTCYPKSLFQNEHPRLRETENSAGYAAGAPQSCSFRIILGILGQEERPKH